jgi:hypothetical protein
MDTGGLISALTDQSGLIARAIPDDLGGQLKGSGILDAVMDGAGGAGAAATVAARATGDTVDGAVDTAQQTAQKSSSLIRWVVIAAVILAAFYFLSGEVA